MSTNLLISKCHFHFPLQASPLDTPLAAASRLRCRVNERRRFISRDLRSTMRPIDTILAKSQLRADIALMATFAANIVCI